MSDLNLESKISDPILHYFSVEGLNDYKNIKLTLEKNIKIISAENGSGKTTLLNMLYSLLSGKTARLLKINFKKFTLKIGNQEIFYAKNELFPRSKINKKMIPSIIQRRFILYNLSDDDIREMLMLYATDSNNGFWVCNGVKKLLLESPYDREDIKEMFEEIYSKYEWSDKFIELEKKIKSALDANNISILYLPTYRRIEADISEFDNANLTERTRHSGFRRARTESIEPEQLIYFGLQDVEKRLINITTEIRDATLEAYSRINARNLDQLVELDEKRKHIKIKKEQVNTIKVALARVGKSNTNTENKIIDLIESGEINDHKYEQLEMHLNQLIEIYQEKSSLDQIIEEFVNVVNSYLGHENTEKKFEFDKLTVDVRVLNKITNKALPLNALSSGEKQIVSIFNRLYLDTRKKYLILIDEPELSLSLEWQKKFLPDILNTPSCKQLIAITHSPFIFENELDKYAGSLDISYRKTNE